MTKCFDLEVSLEGIQPKIWRRLLIDSKANFLDLHEAIQEAAPWQNYHLFSFRTRKNQPIAGLPDDEDEKPEPDARKVRLDTHFRRKGTMCLYWYDFGDNWWHKVTLVGTVETPGRTFRSLIDGARSFPPEDCGGSMGYDECVAVSLGRKKDPGRLTWLGDWTPEEFNLSASRRAFDLKSRRKRYRGDYGF